MNDRRPSIFNLIVCAVMFIAAVALIAVRGSNVPSWDDWDNVPVITHHQPVTMDWLWSQHNEHRDPLPRLIIVALNRLIAPDFRTAMYFDVVATGAIALALIFALRKARGRSSYFDAFIPIVLLHYGQAENLLWGWQVQFYASALLACLILVLITRIEPPRNISLLLGIGICVPLLAMCGANGLILVPPLAVWLGYAAFVQLGATTSSRAAILLALACSVSTVVVGLYFVDYHGVPYHPSNHSMKNMLATAMKFLTMGLGPGVVGLDSTGLPMPFWQIICAAITSIFMMTIALLLWTWWRDRAERLRSAGLLMFVGSMAAIALALGMGREGFEPRYVTLSVPAMCAMYIAWSIYGKNRWKAVMPAALTIFALAAFIPNTIFGLNYSYYLKANLSAFENEMVAGAPLYRLINHHHEYLHPHDQTLMDYLPMLRDAHVGNFKLLRDNPPFREIHVPLIPVKTYDMKWDNGTAVATGIYPWATFALPNDVNAAGIRIRYTFTSPDVIGPYFIVNWRSSDEADFPKANFKKFTPTGDYANWKNGTWSRINDVTTTMNVWPCDKIQMLKVCMFSTMGTTKFYDITLLVPEKSTTQDSDDALSQTSSHPASHPLEHR